MTNVNGFKFLNMSNNPEPAEPTNSGGQENSGKSVNTFHYEYNKGKWGKGDSCTIFGEDENGEVVSYKVLVGNKDDDFVKMLDIFQKYSTEGSPEIEYDSELFEFNEEFKDTFDGYSYGHTDRNTYTSKQEQIRQHFKSERDDYTADFSQDEKNITVHEMYKWSQHISNWD